MPLDNTNTPPRTTREPLFNLTPMVKALLALNIAVHVLRLLLSPQADDWVVTHFGFIAARFTRLSYFDWSGLVTFITYQFLHEGWGHLLMNVAFAMAVGTACERRLGPWRMLALTLIAGIAGALAHLAIYPFDVIVLVGFSGATSGLLAATLFFVYGAAGRDGLRRFAGFSAVWIAINVASGISGWPFGSGVQIAWVAHIGGYAAGTILAWRLDPWQRAA